jgi:hypothetical protein
VSGEQKFYENKREVEAKKICAQGIQTDDFCLRQFL